MELKRFYPILLLLLLHSAAGPVRAQLTVESEWAAYTSMSEANDVVVVGQDVWMATRGGALHYNRDTGTYRRFTRLDGLGGNQLLAVTADQRGDLWFGTAGKGLSRLRAGAANFDPPFLEFRDRDIVALMAHGDQLFVGTDRGVSVFLLDKEEVKESYRRLGNLQKDATVNALAIHNDILFVASSEGMAWARMTQPNLQDPDSWRSTGIGDVFDLVIDDELVVAAAKQGAYTFNPAADQFTLEYSDQSLLSVGVFRDLILAATEAGTFFQRLGSQTWRPIPASIIRDVRRMYRADDGTVWMATGEGIRVFGGAAPAPSGEPGSSQFYDLQLVDGDLWAASVPDDQQRTLSAGVSQFREATWTVYDKRSGMPNDELVALETDQFGRIWVGSWGGGIAVRDGDVWRRMDQRNSAMQGIGSGRDFVAVGDVERDTDGNMWIVNVAVGVAVVDGFPQRQGFLFDQVALNQPARMDLYRIGFSSTGLKLLASRTDGLVLLDDGGTPFIGGDDQLVPINRAVEPRLSSNRAFAVLEDEDGTMWLATDSGLNAIRGSFDREAGRFDVDSWRVYGSLDGLPSDEISALELDADGHLWVGTGGGLSRIDDGEVAFTLTSSNSGLINDRVTGLLLDAESNELWVGTFDGLSRLRLGTTSTNPDNPFNQQTIYPHPFVADGRSPLTFAGLPLGASLQIFTMQGELVRILAGEPGRGTLSWDGLNEAGFLVGSGIYLYVAQAPSSPPIRGRIAVIDGVRP